jgi:hypothetical protein
MIRDRKGTFKRGDPGPSPVDGAGHLSVARSVDLSEAGSYTEPPVSTASFDRPRRSRRRRSPARAIALFTGLLCLAGGAPQEFSPAAAGERPSEEALRAIETLGRRIASYHEALARARERLPREGADLRQGIRLVVVERGGAWKVIVMRRGEGDAAAQGWKMLAEIGFNAKAGEVTTFQRFAPPKQAPSDALAALQAIDVVTGTIALHLPLARAPFAEAVFREPDKSHMVYLQPATEVAAEARFGADIRSQVSSDGTKVLKSSPLHGTAAWVAVSPSPRGEPTLHSHVEGDLPTETDVALVIENPKLAPHLVLTPRHMFRIDAAGAITYLGPNQVPPAPPGAAPDGGAPPGGAL